MTSRRRTLAGAVGALALAAGLVFAGSVAAQADGGLEITTSTTAATGGAVITGTPSDALPAGPIDVLYGAPGTPLGSMSLLGPATITGATWTFTSLLPPGQYQIGVQSGANTDSEPVEVTLPTPVVTAPSSAPEGGTFDFEGTGGYLGATVVVSIPGAETETGDPMSCSAGPLAASGAWNCSIPFDAEFVPGPTYTFDVVQTRPAVAPGAAPTATASTWDVTVQDLPDDLAVTAPADGGSLPWDETITYSGTAPTTAVDVDLTVDGLPEPGCDNLPVSALRTWSCTTTGPAVGAHTVVASQGVTDSPTVNFEVVYPAPVVTSTDPHVAFAGNTVTISGTSTYPGVTIAITTSSPVGDCDTLTPMPAAGTAWNCVLTVDPDVSGEFDLYVQQNLAGSPVGPWWLGTLDVLEAPVIESPVSGDEVDWSGGSTLTTISGIADPAGGTISLMRTVSGSPDPIPGCGAIAVQPDGSWSCDANFDPGLWDIYAFQGSAMTSVLDWAVYIPAPVPDDAPLVVPNTEQFVFFTGTNLYEGIPVAVSIRGTGGICTDDDPTPNAYSCDIEAWGEFGDGYYTVDVYQDGGINVPHRTATFDLTYGTPPAPTLTIDAPANNTDVTYDSAPNFLVVRGSTAELGDVSVFLDGSSTAFCTATPAAGQWTCPGTTLSPGAHTAQARQDGQPSAYSNFDVALPEPGVDGAPFAFDADQDLVFGGQQRYPGAWTRVEVYEEAEGSPFGPAQIEEDCAPAGGFWSCTIPQNLSGGQYLVRFIHFLPGQPAIPGDPTGYSTVTIGAGPIGGAADLRCRFSPGGGVSVSSPLSMDNLDLNAVYTEYGSSSGDAFGLQGYCNGRSGTAFLESDELYFDQIQNCTTSCSQSSLEPGVYEVYYTVADTAANEGFSFEPHSYLFTVPTEPVISTVASTTNSVILSGSSEPGSSVRIERSTGASLCTTTASATGAWACQFVKSSATAARAIAIDPSGAMSTYTAERAIPPFVPTVVPTQEETLDLVTWFLQFGGDLMDLHPGDSFTLSVSGMPEGTEIEVWMHSTPVLIGTATGTGLPMELTLTVPENIENGAHEIEMIGVTPLGTNYFFTSDAWVSGGTDPLPPLKDAPPLDDKTGIGPYDRTDPASPSALSDGLAPLSAIAANPATLAIAGGLALALLFLVALPTELLNSSLSSNSSRLGRVYGTIDGALTKAQDWFVTVTRSRAVAAAILTTIVAIIYGFVDPGFGFDIVSLRLVLSLAIAFFILSFVASWISGMIIRRAWGAIGMIEMQPTIILFAIVGVIVARILDFSPGFLVGIAIGLELLQASKTVTARAVFVQLGVVTGLSLAAWVVYSIFTPGDDFVGMLVDDTMVAVTAEGLTGALIAIFPLRFLDGRDLWEVSKRLWITAFLVIATAFALLVLPTAIQGTDVRDYGVWLLVFAVFGLISVAVWLVFVRAAARAEKAEPETVDA